MKRISYIDLLIIFLLIGFTIGFLAVRLFPQEFQKQQKIDEKVKTFLNSNQRRWRDANVPASDGKILYDLIIKHKYKKALEICTSTGHSSIWIAWALSKTGGKLITIEINERRYKEALSNFKEVGLSEYIDAKLADAHQVVPDLEGPFDFVFSNADKKWYKNYFMAVDPKLEVGGCYTTHNVSDRRRDRKYRRGGRSGSYLDFLLSLPNYETIVDQSSVGMAISFKKSDKQKILKRFSCKVYTYLESSKGV